MNNKKRLPKLPKAFTRRSFLKNFAYTSTLTLPFWKTLLDTEILYANTNLPPLFFAFYYPDATIHKYWSALGEENEFNFNFITSPLESVKEHISIFNGVNYLTSGSHEGGLSFCLTGVDGGRSESLDTFCGRMQRGHYAQEVIRLGVSANFQNGSGHFSFLSNGQNASFQDDPKQAFIDYFGPKDGTMSSSDKFDLYTGKKRTIDFSRNQIKSLMSKLGQIEKEKLEANIDGLDQLELKINLLQQQAKSNNGSSCSQYNIPLPAKLEQSSIDQKYWPYFHGLNENFKMLGDVQKEIAISALLCGATSSVSLQWSHPVSPNVFNFEGGTGHNIGHHSASHYGGSESSLAMIHRDNQQWFMKRLAEVIKGLEVEQGGSRLIDRVSLLCFTELSDSDLHNFQNMPVLSAGSCNGALATGKYLKYENESWNKVLTSVAKAHGSTQDYFGDSSKGKGTLNKFFIK